MTERRAERNQDTLMRPAEGASRAPSASTDANYLHQNLPATDPTMLSDEEADGREHLPGSNEAERTLAASADANFPHRNLPATDPAILSDAETDEGVHLPDPNEAERRLTTLMDEANFADLMDEAYPPETARMLLFPQIEAKLTEGLHRGLLPTAHEATGWLSNNMTDRQVRMLWYHGEVPTFSEGTELLAFRVITPISADTIAAAGQTQRTFRFTLMSDAPHAVLHMLIGFLTHIPVAETTYAAITNIRNVAIGTTNYRAVVNLPFGADIPQEMLLRREIAVLIETPSYNWLLGHSPLEGTPSYPYIWDPPRPAEGAELPRAVNLVAREEVRRLREIAEDEHGQQSITSNTANPQAAFRTALRNMPEDIKIHFTRASTWLLMSYGLNVMETLWTNGVLPTAHGTQPLGDYIRCNIIPTLDPMQRRRHGVEGRQLWTLLPHDAQVGVLHVILSTITKQPIMDLDVQVLGANIPFGVDLPIEAKSRGRQLDVTVRVPSYGWFIENARPAAHHRRRALRGGGHYTLVHATGWETKLHLEETATGEALYEQAEDATRIPQHCFRLSIDGRHVERGRPAPAGVGQNVRMTLLLAGGMEHARERSPRRSQSPNAPPGLAPTGSAPTTNKAYVMHDDDEDSMRGSDVWESDEEDTRKTGQNGANASSSNTFKPANRNRRGRPAPWESSIEKPGIRLGDKADLTLGHTTELPMHKLRLTKAGIAFAKDNSIVDWVQSEEHGRRHSSQCALIAAGHKAFKFEQLVNALGLRSFFTEPGRILETCIETYDEGLEKFLSKEVTIVNFGTQLVAPMIQNAVQIPKTYLIEVTAICYKENVPTQFWDSIVNAATPSKVFQKCVSDTLASAGIKLAEIVIFGLKERSPATQLSCKIQAAESHKLQIYNASETNHLSFYLQHPLGYDPEYPLEWLTTTLKETKRIIQSKCGVAGLVMSPQGKVAARIALDHLAENRCWTKKDIPGYIKENAHVCPNHTAEITGFTRGTTANMVVRVLAQSQSGLSWPGWAVVPLRQRIQQNQTTWLVGALAPAPQRKLPTTTGPLIITMMPQGRQTRQRAKSKPALGDFLNQGEEGTGRRTSRPRRKASRSQSKSRTAEDQEAAPPKSTTEQQPQQAPAGGILRKQRVRVETEPHTAQKQNAEQSRAAWPGLPTADRNQEGKRIDDLERKIAAIEVTQQSTAAQQMQQTQQIMTQLSQLTNAVGQMSKRVGGAGA